LGSHGPKKDFDKAKNIAIEKAKSINKINDKNYIADEISSYKLEHSYIGIIGKSIEPIIKPIGYDWKIGVAVVSSFAAREVFVGTLATIYSVGSHNTEETTIKKRMESEVYEDTGGKVFNFATGVSLLLFYAFAMQCISTLAIVKKETNSWKWPIIQLFFMSGFAYLTALIAYQLLK
jgi:ferrous iron transport protein B